MKIKKLLFVLLAVLLVFSLFSCGKKEPVEDVEPQGTTEPDLDDIKSDKNTIEIDGKQYDISDTVHSDVPQKTEVLLTTEELHALFKKEYEYNEWGKVNLGEYYESMCLKLPAREIGTQADANAYSRVEADVKAPEYEGKILPDDGFEQYVAWREALEKVSESNSTTSGSTGNTNNETQKPSTKPSGGSNNSSGGSSNNGGSSGNNSGYSENVYEGAGVEHEVHDNGFGDRGEEQEYEKPSYEIVG